MAETRALSAGEVGLFAACFWLSLLRLKKISKLLTKMAATCEPHSPKEKLPLPPEDLRAEVVNNPVKLRHTEVKEKIILPTEEDIKFEKSQECLSPILHDVAQFDKGQLRKSQIEEKTLLPTPEEYNQIKNEKKEFRDAITNFDQGKLKHVTTQEKHEIAAIDEASGK